MSWGIKSSLVQALTYPLLGAGPMPESMLYYCHMDTRGNLQWIFNQNTNTFIQNNASKMFSEKISAILFSPLCATFYLTSEFFHTSFSLHPTDQPITLVSGILKCRIKTSSNVRANPLQWCHMSITESQITSNLTVWLTSWYSLNKLEII